MTEGYSQELALFDSPIIDHGVVSVDYVEYQPTAPLNESAALEFHYSGSSSDYVDLSKIIIKLKVKILKADGSQVVATDNVGLINLPMQTMFSQLDVFMQDKLITSSTNSHYTYKALLDVMFNSKPEDEQSHLTSQLFYRDSAKNMDGSAIAITGETPVTINSGLKQRHDYTCEGGSIDLEGPLYFDMAQQNRLLLNGVSLHFKLWPNRPDFKLMSFNDEKYKVEIVEAKLNMCMVKVDPTIILAHASTLKDYTAIYNYDKSHLISYQIPVNSYQFMQDDVFQSEIPTSLMVCITSSKAFAGDYKKNPLSFNHWNVKSVGMYVDGKCQPNSRPITVDYANSNFMEGYTSIQRADGSGLKITRDNYPNGYNFYSFNIDPRYNKSLALPPRKGLTRIEIHFDKPTTEALTVIVYAKIPAQIKIDGARNVII